MSSTHNFTPEMRKRIRDAWRVHSSARAVAEAMGCSVRSATRYKPSGKVSKHPRALTPEKKKQIALAWRRCQTASQVAKECGVSAHTACAYRPIDIASVQMGYSTWSDETKKRWDDWWLDEGRLNRVDIIENWNRQWLKNGRGGK